jgi:hypothetical protein
MRADLETLLPTRIFIDVASPQFQQFVGGTFADTSSARTRSMSARPPPNGLRILGLDPSRFRPTLEVELGLRNAHRHLKGDLICLLNRTAEKIEISKT